MTNLHLHVLHFKWTTKDILLFIQTNEYLIAKFGRAWIEMNVKNDSIVKQWISYEYNDLRLRISARNSMLFDIHWRINWQSSSFAYQIFSIDENHDRIKEFE